MSELVHYDRLEVGVVGSGQRVGVVDASTAIGIGIGQDDDVFVRNACQPVVDAFYAAGGEVTVRIEGAEVGTYGCRFPNALMRDAYAAVLRWAGHSHDVEAVLQLRERFVCKQRLASGLCVLIEKVHFGFGVSFCQDSHIDAFFR